MTAVLGSSVALVHRQPSAAFNWPATRFWESMIGSLAACRSVQTTLRLSNLAAITGLALLGFAFVLVQDGRGFPGWWTLRGRATGTTSIGLDVVLIAHCTSGDQKTCEASVGLTLQELNTNGVSVGSATVLYPPGSGG